jgi:hypothetical protein
MKSIVQLEQEAGQRHQSFNATLGILKQRITLPQLADDAIGLLKVQPNASPLKSISIASAIWLVQNLARKAGQPLRRKSKIQTLKQEKKHEN